MFTHEYEDLAMKKYFYIYLYFAIRGILIGQKQRIFKAKYAMFERYYKNSI